ncbi:MAG: hypothetical protein H0W30_15830 [Gemmatimonadaceae bacterium]|nr:hypothetical protein [Gemmatimonadaceae bacterium]MDQ3517801.1 hypothetical protein [Gemmatimonadota bacterium]
MAGGSVTNSAYNLEILVAHRLAEAHGERRGRYYTRFTGGSREAGGANGTGKMMDTWVDGERLQLPLPTHAVSGMHISSSSA